MDRLTLAPRFRLWVRVAFLAAALATLATMLAHVSLARVLEALRATDVALLLGLGLPLLAGTFVLRALRFRALLCAHGDARASFLEVLRAVIMSHGANNVLPLRAGELVRTREIVAGGSSLRVVALAQITEKVVELATILVWIVPAIDLLAPGNSALVLLIEGALLLGFVVWAWWNVPQGQDAVAVLGRIRRAFAIGAAFAVSLLADGLEVALIAVCMASVGVTPSLAASVAVLGTTNLAIALPSTPGQLGTFEAGASIGLLLAGAPRALALAFAVIYRVVQWVPVTLAAGVAWFMGAPVRDVALASEEESSSEEERLS